MFAAVVFMLHLAMSLGGYISKQVIGNSTTTHNINIYKIFKISTLVLFFVGQKFFFVLYYFIYLSLFLNILLSSNSATLTLKFPNLVLM